MLKILQARLQQYMNRELPDVQAAFRKGRAGESQGRGSLVCCRLWGRTESDMTDVT